MLKRLREKAGLTQRRLSELSGVPYRTIQDWEKGVTGKDWCRNLLALSDALGCSLDDLVRKE